MEEYAAREDQGGKGKHEEGGNGSGKQCARSARMHRMRILVFVVSGRRWRIGKRIALVASRSRRLQRGCAEVSGRSSEGSNVTTIRMTAVSSDFFKGAGTILRAANYPIEHSRPYIDLRFVPNQQRNDDYV